ncbi:hypothetical protein B0H14DRAFT_2559745 [Mycena olivaceomarginata]|nr:hypothetical protein B0H14DRAFT_2559745 [Mycena olivaceomarginata]
MPRPITVVITTLPFVTLGIGYYRHRHLSAAYPTFRVPPALEISARHDWPALGMSATNANGRNTEPWMQTHVGDMFVATVPRQLLEHDNSEDTPLVVFARTFWDSWPLRIERRILHHVEGTSGLRASAVFIETARILDGLAHEAPLGPLVTSWWLRPSEAFPKPGRVGILGGYHSFAVEDTPQIGNEPEPTRCAGCRGESNAAVAQHGTNGKPYGLTPSPTGDPAKCTVHDASQVLPPMSRY